MYTYRNRFFQEYFLHTRQVTLRHHLGTIHFFSKQLDGALEDLPAGYQVLEGKNGFPTLQKIPPQEFRFKNGGQFKSVRDEAYCDGQRTIDKAGS